MRGGEIGQPPAEIFPGSCCYDQDDSFTLLSGTGSSVFGVSSWKQIQNQDWVRSGVSLKLQDLQCTVVLWSGTVPVIVINELLPTRLRPVHSLFQMTCELDAGNDNSGFSLHMDKQAVIWWMFDYPAQYLPPGQTAARISCLLRNVNIIFR